MGQLDSIVIYGSVKPNDKTWITQNRGNLGHNYYLVNDLSSPNINKHEINHAQWLTLIIEHKNTLTWK